MSKTKQNQKNKRTFYITNSNLEILNELGDILISEPTHTKLVNYAIDSVLATWLKAYKIEAKTPAQKEKSNFNLSNEVKKYATSEESFR